MKHRYFFIFVISTLFLINSINAQSVDIVSNKDNTMWQILPEETDTLSNGAGQNFFAGVNNQNPLHARRGLLAFNIAANIPEGAMINSATLRLHLSSTNSQNGEREISIHRVTSDWGEGDSDASGYGEGQGTEGAGAPSLEGDASWLHTFYPDTYWDNDGGDFDAAVSATQTVDTVGYYTWGSTETMVENVQHWLDIGQNYGWIVIGREDTTKTAKGFDTHENETDAFHPMLHVEYNEAPVIGTLPIIGFYEDSSIIITKAYLLEYVSDSGTPDSLLSVQISGEDTINVIDNGTSYSFSAPQNWYGEEMLDIEISDGQLSSQAQLTVQAISVNDDPYFTGLPDSLNVDSTLTFSIWDLVEDVENSDSELSYQFESANDSLTYSYVSESGMLTLTRNWAFFGSVEFTITVTDDSSAVAESSITVIVDYNTAPEILPLPDVTFNEDDSASVLISDLYPFVNDIGTADSLLLVQIIGGDDVNIHLNKDSTGVIVSAPENWFGDESIQVDVSDGQLATRAFLNIHVLPVNDTPLFSGLVDTLNIDSTLNISLWDFVEDVESPDSALSYQIESANDSLTFSYDSTNGLLKLSRHQDFEGYVKLSITVTDDSNAVAMDSILIHVSGIVLVLEDDLGAVPKEFKLLQNYPNPFNPATKIRFALPKAENVILEIYNALGQKIITLMDKQMSTGHHEVEFNAQHLSSGIYFYKIEAGKFVDMKKMVLLK